MKRVSRSRKAIQLSLVLLILITFGYFFLRNQVDYASIAYPPIPELHYKFIDDAVEHCKIPMTKRGFIAAVAFAESTFHADARSGAGAVGVMQLLRGTGYGTAIKYQIAGLNANTFTDPGISYKMGTCYIHYLMGEIAGNYNPENWDNENMLAAIMVGYNAGPASGKNYLRVVGTNPQSGRRSAYSGPVGYAHKVIRATPVYNLDFARYDQRAVSEPLEPLTKVRELVWSYFLREDASVEE